MSQAKQYWFAYDATGCGSLQDNRLWWDEFIVAGPDLGYYPKARKCWLVIKPGKEELLRASLKRRQSTSHWKEAGSTWLRLSTPDPIASSTSTVKWRIGWDR